MNNDNTKIVEKLMTLFRGSTRAHGVYTETIEDPLKQKVKGKAMTIPTGPTLKKWLSHFNGEVGLGIIPINEDNQCYWGVLDIDGVVDHMLLQTRIQELKLPLVCCYSKSKSAHCFLFVENAIDASVMRALLEEMASKLGFAGCEIFPKQDKLNIEKGDLGNWLNMPYFGGTRLGVLLTDGELVEQDVDTFLDFAFANRLTPESLTDFMKQLKTNLDVLEDNELLRGAPPCLQYKLKTHGIVDGERNKMIFNIAVYCKMRYTEEEFRDKVKEIHDEYSSDPLSIAEMDRIIKSVEDKDYRYQCKDAILKQFCNSSICVDREYGIELSSEVKTIKDAVRILSDPLIYAVEVELDAGLPAKVYVETETLFNQERFRIECSKQLHKTFIPIGAKTWSNIATRIINSAINQDPPTDMSEENKLYAALLDYILNKIRHQITALAEPDGVYHDQENHMIYFKLEDFRTFLLRKQLYGKELTTWKLGNKLNNLYIPTDEVDFKEEKRIKRRITIEETTKKVRGKALYLRCIPDKEINLVEIIDKELKET